MKKLIFGLIATVVLSLNVNAQDTKANGVNDSARISCKRFSVGVNILIAWVETDLYLACGFPAGAGIGGGTCLFVSEKVCNILGKNVQNREPSTQLNIKDYFNNVDTSKVEIVEITKSSSWTNEDETVSSLKLGKYPVDKDGFFEPEIE